MQQSPFVSSMTILLILEKTSTRWTSLMWHMCRASRASLQRCTHNVAFSFTHFCHRLDTATAITVVLDLSANSPAQHTLCFCSHMLERTPLNCTSTHTYPAALIALIIQMKQVSRRQCATRLVGYFLVTALPVARRSAATAAARDVMSCPVVARTAARVKLKQTIACATLTQRPVIEWRVTSIARVDIPLGGHCCSHRSAHCRYRLERRQI